MMSRLDSDVDGDGGVEVVKKKLLLFVAQSRAASKLVLGSSYAVIDWL